MILSWTQELYKVYEQQLEQQRDKPFNDGSMLLPVSHSTANAQIEVTLNQDGSFVSARKLIDNEGKDTIIPVSAASGKRSGRNPPPHPLTDKLFYLAGDTIKYTIYKMEKGTKQYIDSTKYVAFHNAYMKQLKDWEESCYSHKALPIIYSYLEKETFLTDLLNEHILTLKGEELEEKELGQFVRFYIQYEDFHYESRTWLDNSLYNSYIDYALHLQSDAPSDLCYATGKQLSIMDNTEHSKQIIPRCANAKLICLNNQSLTYAGRFQDDTQALRVSYDFSQKMHNALRWLIQRQGISFDTMSLLVWTSSLKDSPNIMDSACDDDPFPEPVTPDTEPRYRDFLRKQIFGTKPFDITSKVMLMGVDAATTGRLSIAIYEELEHSRLLEQLVTWHSDTSVVRYNRKANKHSPNSFAVKEIINCAYGLENSKGFMEAKPEIIRDNVLRLLPCITQGRQLPSDIVQNLVKKASNPLAYERSWRIVLETACGMIRKQNIEHRKGVTSMAYDPNETDRSYLFGCLLAIADWAERTSYDKSESQDRITNAKRYWSRFAQRPSETWAYLYNKLIPYLNRLQKNDYPFYKKFNEMVSDVTAKFVLEEFSDNSPLTSAYLLGYHHFNAEIYKKKEEE